MYGHQAINMHFWPLSHTMCPMMGNLVCISFDPSTRKYLRLAEELINFHELIGEHLGDNMVEAIWQTIELYGLVGRVCSSFFIYRLTSSQIIAIVMDNASNNNTLMTSLELRCQQWGIPFLAQDACMQCMPHTIHLAVIKVLYLYLLIVIAGI